LTYRSPQISVVSDGRLEMTATRCQMGGLMFNPDSEGLQRWMYPLETWKLEG